MDKLNPLLLPAIIIGGLAFIWLFWRFMRPEIPKCKCGAAGRLMTTQESGQRNVYTYHCSAGCGGVWQVTDKSFEERMINNNN